MKGQTQFSGPQPDHRRSPKAAAASRLRNPKGGSIGSPSVVSVRWSMRRGQPPVVRVDF